MKPEGSHLCRYAVNVGAVTNPDGTVYELVEIRENKACFNPEHMTMEAALANRNRIHCPGGNGCEHLPHCEHVINPSA